jgi:predicted lipid-binding transport protein (Tim44 family)
MFDESQDGRRKYILRQTKEDLGSAESLLDRVAQAFSKGENAQLQQLLSSRLTAQSDGTLKESETAEKQVSLSYPHYYRRYPIVNSPSEAVH